MTNIEKRLVLGFVVLAAVLGGFIAGSIAKPDSARASCECGQCGEKCRSLVPSPVRRPFIGATK